MSSLSESITSWESDNGVIRVTSEGQPSVFDIIKVLGGLKNPRKTWERLIKTHPEIITWIQYYKFKGPGQRETPILASSDKINLFKEFVLSGTSQKKKIKHKKYFSGVPITEKTVQEAYVSLLRSNRFNVKEYVSCSSGIADIVYGYHVVEVKEIQSWKAAIGQAIIYSFDLGLKPEIFLFGKSLNIKNIIYTCETFGIDCCFVDSKNNSLNSFVQNPDFVHVLSLH